MSETSRPHGSQPPAAGRGQAGSYAVQPDPRAWPNTAPGRPQHSGSAAQAPGQAYVQQPAQSYPAQVEVPAIDPYAQYQGYAQPAAAPRQAASYAPQFDPYVAQQPVQQTYAPQAAEAHYRQAAQDTNPGLRGPLYDQWQGQAAGHDPRAYDLASYTPPSAQSQTGAAPGFAQAYAQQPQAYATPQAAAADAHNVNWGHGDPYAQAAQDHGYEAQGLSIPPQQGGAGADQGYAEEDAGYEVEEPPRGRRMMSIAAVLAGAIVLGGGLTYAYHAILGGGGDGKLPLVKSAEGPAKVKPAEPGGKQFAHSDSKIMGRLGEGEAAGADSDPGGTKKVPTLVVGRDGSIQPPAASSGDAPPAAAPAATAAVPGMSIVNVGGGPAPAPAPAAAPAEAAAPVTAAAATPQKPLVVNPPAAPAAPEKVAVAKPAAPAAPAPVAPAPAPQTAAAPAPAAPAAQAKKPAPKPAPTTTASTGSAPTGAGYMAVLASVPASSTSRMNALSQWADMQQKYGPILQDKTPSVQEANLGEKGIYHRLLAGPPGSKDAASAVCTQLKAQGYADCWVMAY